MQAARTRARFPVGRIAALLAAIAVLAAGFFTASVLTRPSPGPSALNREIERTEQAVRGDPDNLSLRLSLAQTYLQADRTVEALEQFQQALVVDPKNEEALLGAGVAHHKLGQTDEAIKAFATILAQNRGNPYAQVSQRLETARYYLGRIYREQGKLDQAINELRLALAIDRGDADVLLELGRAFQAKGSSADAVSAYELALAYVPDYVEAYWGLAEAARAQRDEIKTQYAEAMLLVFQGKVKEGARRLEKLAPESNDARVWWGLGYANEQLDRVGEALKAYQQAIEINPGERLAADALARLQGQIAGGP